MRRFIFWASLISGAIAAYAMYQRGESLGTIAKKTTTDPIGTLVSEIKNA
jgi:uncharacterized protein (DUF697 family)